MSASAEFDPYVGKYDEALQSGLAVVGEGRDYFAQGRLRWLSRSLRELNVSARSALDFGCGIGDTSLLFRQILGVEHYTGVDASSRSIEFARSKFGSAERRFATTNDLREGSSFDLAYCNGVFHHIAVAARAAAARQVLGALRPGGIFAFWENNPWNPGTRYLMSRIPFDRDARPISATAASRLLGDAGFQILSCEFLFIFPRQLRWLRALEPRLAQLPLGGQYQVLCRRPAN